MPPSYIIFQLLLSIEQLELYHLLAYFLSLKHAMLPLFGLCELPNL